MSMRNPPHTKRVQKTAQAALGKPAP